MNPTTYNLEPGTCDAQRRAYPPMAHPECDVNFHCPLKRDLKAGRVVVLEGRAVYDSAQHFTARGWSYRRVDGTGTGSRQPACLVISAEYLSEHRTLPQRERLLLFYYQNTGGTDRAELERLTKACQRHDQAERELFRQRRPASVQRRETRQRQIAADERSYKDALAYLTTGEKTKT